ncbi:MAG: ABC transporter substrate-binding protein [Patescibacteria group bacterium]
MKFIKIIIAILVVGGGIWLIAGWNQQTKVPSSEPFKLGFIGPLTSDAAVYGIDEQNAVTLAVEEINQSGGISGRRIEVIYEDGKCTGKDAATAAQKLINIDKVKIILGGICSSETLAMAPITEQNKVLVFSALSSSPEITKAGDYVFRNSPSDLDVAKGYADYIFKKAGYKNIAVLSENTDYGMGVRQVFSEAFKNLGGMIVADEVFRQGERDFRVQLAKIKSANPQAVFINPQAGITGGLVLKQLKELGVTTPIFSVFVFSGEDARVAAGGSAEGLVFFDVVGLTTEKGKEFRDKFISRFSKIGGSDYDVGARYDSVYILADAMKKCSEDTDCLKRYLYNLDWYDGVIGRYKFDENGDVVGINPLTPKTIRGGRVELLR